jgi:hypothetical protein
LARTPNNAWKTRNIGPCPPVARGGVGPKNSDRKTLGPSLTTCGLMKNGKPRHELACGLSAWPDGPEISSSIWSHMM